MILKDRAYLNNSHSLQRLKDNTRKGTELFRLLCHYAACYFKNDVSVLPIRPIFKGIFLGPIGRPETSALSQHKPRNNPEDGIIQFKRSRKWTASISRAPSCIFRKCNACLEAAGRNFRSLLSNKSNCRGKRNQSLRMPAFYAIKLPGQLQCWGKACTEQLPVFLRQRVRNKVVSSKSGALDNRITEFNVHSSWLCYL